MILYILKEWLSASLFSLILSIFPRMYARLSFISDFSTVIKQSLCIMLNFCIQNYLSKSPG